MKANPDKCHLITSCDNETSVCLNNYNIANGKWEELLGIKFDHMLNVNIHIDEIS